MEKEQSKSAIEAISSFYNEKWKTAKGYPGYWISSTGRVFMETTVETASDSYGGQVIIAQQISGKIMNQYLSNHYPVVEIKNQAGEYSNVYVRQLVGDAFLQGKGRIYSRDKNPLNNCVENLFRKHRSISQKRNDSPNAVNRKTEKHSTRNKPMVMDGLNGKDVFFDSMAEAARMLNISTLTIRNWMYGVTKMPEEYHIRNLRFYIPEMEAIASN